MQDRHNSGAGHPALGPPASLEVRPSERSAKMRYAIRDVLKIAEEARAAGKQLLPLNIGDPLAYDFRTPRHVIEATYQAMLAGHNGYAPSTGVDEALEAIRREAGRLGIRNVQDVFVTTGVTEGIDTAIAALMNPGDSLLIPSPGYPLYETTLAKFGMEPLSYRLDERDGWQPDLEDMARLIGPKTRGIVVINPNNPTGAVCRREILQGIVELAARHGLVLFSDEIYSKLLLDPLQHTPLASLAPDFPVLTFDGLSKSYLVPGFRIGWAILSGEGRSVANYREAIAKILRARLSASHPAQYAIGPALDGDQSHIAETVERLRRRRDLTVSMLNAIPNIHCVSPQAAFYAFPRLEIGRTDQEFVAELIRATGVIVVPGSGFGEEPGSKHFRMVFLPPEEMLGEALRRIGEFAKTWQ